MKARIKSNCFQLIARVSYVGSCLLFAEIESDDNALSILQDAYECGIQFKQRGNKIEFAFEKDKTTCEFIAV